MHVFMHACLFVLVHVLPGFCLSFLSVVAVPILSSGCHSLKCSSFHCFCHSNNGQHGKGCFNSCIHSVCQCTQFLVVRRHTIIMMPPDLCCSNIQQHPEAHTVMKHVINFILILSSEEKGLDRPHQVLVSFQQSSSWVMPTAFRMHRAQFRVVTALTNKTLLEASCRRRIRWV